MINLPKPSQLRMSGEPQEQTAYILNYLKTLVAALEKTLGSLGVSSSVDSTAAITNVAYTKNGIVIVRSDGSEQTIASNKVLWEDAYIMNENQTAYLSSKVSEQTNGIVLVFCAYVNGTAQIYHFQDFFIPKEIVRLQASRGHNFLLDTAEFKYIGNKYLYIHDDHINGNALNDDTGTKNGVTYANNHWVLRYVIGV